MGTGQGASQSTTGRECTAEMHRRRVANEAPSVLDLRPREEELCFRQATRPISLRPPDIR